MNYIIQKTANKTGSRPPMQSWGDYPVPDGFVLCSPDFLDTFTQAKGFVKIEIQTETNIVTAMTENTEAKQAFEATPTPDPTPEEKIATLKQNLSDTDYQAIKFAEGWLTAEEYEPIKLQRQAWRDEINTLEQGVL